MNIIKNIYLFFQTPMSYFLEPDFQEFAAKSKDFARIFKKIKSLRK